MQLYDIPVRTMNQPYIQMKNVCFSYNTEEGRPARQVLKNITLTINRGEFVAVLGHNGSGKSTLAKLLNLILLPDSGSIIIDGKEVTSPDLSDDEVYETRRHVGMVFQNPDNQLVATVVEEDVAFGPENLGIPPAEIRARVDKALELVGMSEYRRHSPSRLSGGQKQRIAIAGIIAMLPDCIVFDEPTAMLDPSGRAEVMNIIRMLNRDRGITVLHITHNMNEAITADRVIVINDGELCMDDTPRRVFSQVAKLHSIGLDVPQVTELLYELGLCGVELPVDVLTYEECADLLIRKIEERK